MSILTEIGQLADSRNHQNSLPLVTFADSLGGPRFNDLDFADLSPCKKIARRILQQLSKKAKENRYVWSALDMLTTFKNLAHITHNKRLT